MRNLPFRDVVPNNAWFQLVLCALDLVAWTKGALPRRRARDLRAQATPLRVLDCAGRIVRSARRVTVRVQEGWPLQDKLVAVRNRRSHHSIR